jgi:hypothetical protein
MFKRKHMGWYGAFAVIVILSLALAGCGGGAKATPTAEAKEPTAKAQATTAPTTASSDKTQPTATTASSDDTSSSQTDLEKTLDNVKKLAPVHMVSSYTYKKGNETTSDSKVEADLDAKGNQHLLLYDKGEVSAEIYIVDGKLYMGAGDGQYAPLGDMPQDGAFSFLALYGGTYLLALNDLKEAKKLGTETVNGYSATKYEIQYDLASMGVSGLAAGVAGASFDYKGFAWVEPKTSALVAAQVDWSSKAVGDSPAESFHSELAVTKGTIAEIKAPEGIISME